MKLRKNYVIMKVGFLSKHHLQDKVFDSSFPKANNVLSAIAAAAVMMENDDFINFTLIIKLLFRGFYEASAKRKISDNSFDAEILR